MIARSPSRDRDCRDHDRIDRNREIKIPTIHRRQAIVAIAIVDIDDFNRDAHSVPQIRSDPPIDRRSALIEFAPSMIDRRYLAPLNRRSANRSSIGADRIGADRIDLRQLMVDR